MRNKSWHDNIRRGKDRSIFMKAWNNNAPKRWINYDNALQALLRNESAWKIWYNAHCR